MSGVQESDGDMTGWEKIRTKLFLFGVGLLRRMTLGVRLVLIEGDEVFLVRHGYVRGWHFPGGGVEPGETAKESAAREVIEETGYRVAGRMDLLGVYLNAGASDRDHVLVFTCARFEKMRPCKSNMEIVGAGWFSRHQLTEGTTEGTRRRLAEIFEGREPTSLW